MANNIKLYQVALSHKSKSIVDENGHKLNNERLEFLGDAVLSMSVADYLFKHYKDEAEGMLTTTRIKLVNRQYLNKIALELHINQLIRKEKGVVSPKNNLLGNSLEAIIGAVYLDRGYKASCQFVVKWLIKSPEYLSMIVQTETNHKAKLMEWCQKNRKMVLFSIISETRDENSNVQFESEVYVNDELYGIGSGRTKKEAEQHASEQALKKINT